MTATPRQARLRLGGGALILVLMTVVGLVLVNTGGSPDSRANSADPDSTAPSASPSGGASDPSSTDAGTGPGLTEPGVDLRVTVTPDGSFDVHEVVRLARPTDLVRLAAPALSEASSTLDDTRPEATTVQMSADDEVVALDPDSVSGMRAVALDGPVGAYTLHYLLEGATLYTANSTPGRALGAVAPLSRGLSPTLPVRMTISDDDVLNVTCPMLRGAQQLCSRAGDDDGFVIDDLTVDHAVALLQVELG